MVATIQSEVENLLTAQPAVDRQIDRLGATLQGLIRQFFVSRGPAGYRLQSFLNGTWLGHPLHAALSDVPVGAWTAGMVFDYLGALTGDRYAKSAGDWACGVGIAGGVAAATAGLADYSSIGGEQRRFGTVHALLNGVSLGLFALSLVRRLAGQRAEAIPLSTLGYALVVLSADIGGTMVYRYGTMVSHEAFHADAGPQRFKPVLASEDLVDGQKRAVHVDGADVLLARTAGQVYAIGDICTHEGCSLAEGELFDTAIRCACHGSEFSLETGDAIGGPASVAEPSFDVREQNGQIEIRRRPY
jgi:nitrite reductase/ring-hydroxylating ferredoxin subunit/uncharacterized membrane protein